MFKHFNKMPLGSRTLFVFVVCFLKIVASKAKIYLLSSELSFNPAYLDEHRITIHPDKLGLDSILYFGQDLPLDPWIRVTITMKNRKTSRYREVISADNNLCHILGKGEKGFISTWASNILQNSNLPNSCPIRKGRYSFHNLTSEHVNLPNFFAGIYKANLETYLRRKSLKEMVANLTITAQVK